MADPVMKWALSSVDAEAVEQLNRRMTEFVNCMGFAAVEARTAARACREFGRAFDAGIPMPRYKKRRIRDKWRKRWLARATD